MIHILSNNKSFRINPAWLIPVFLMTALFPLRVACIGDVALAASNAPSPPLELRVDGKSHARAFSGDMKSIVDIAGFFEFYEQGLTGGRMRVCSGPWSGKLTENYPGLYTLTGNEPLSGSAYTIVFKQADPYTIELYMTFMAPNKPCSLGFDIVKLSGDLFKGAELDAGPASVLDAALIPVEPRTVARRILLSGKNRVLVKGSLCNLEIRDMAESKSILVADTRSVPWDKLKSITLCAERKNLRPGSPNSFRYSIRSLPPTGSIASAQTTAIASNLQVEESENSDNPWAFFAVPPKSATRADGEYRLQKGDILSGLASGTAETVLQEELEKLASILLARTSAANASKARGILIERVKLPNLPAEGFEIVASPNRIVIRGSGERACLYGVYAFLSRLKRQGNSWVEECGSVRDWPDLPVRGVCIELLRPAIRDVALFKRYLDAFSRARSNVVIFLHTPRQIRSWQKRTDDGGWTREQMAEITRYARSLHLEVWGGMGSGFNAADFKEMDIQLGTNFYSPFNESSYQTLFGLYAEIADAYHPSTMLISHDEIKGLSVYGSISGRSTADIFAKDVVKIHGWLSQRGMKTAMWGDMLLDHNRWEASVGSANSDNSVFNSGATHHALSGLPADILILDWHYTEKNDYASIEYFRRNNFNVVGSSWYDPKAAKALVNSVRAYGGKGVITTDWGFFSTLAPSATTLSAPLCAWSTKCLAGKDNDDVIALAGIMRESHPGIGSLRLLTVNLSAEGNRSTSDVNNGNGIFGLGPIIDLHALPTGVQMFGGMRFEIANGSNGNRSNCVVVANSSNGFALEKEVFEGNASAQAIAFLHTAMMEEPQFRHRNSGRYIVEYETGQSEKIDLVENWNITDIRSSEGLRRNDWTFSRSPDVLIGSKLAWRGNSASGIPLNLQMLIWKNPHPDLKIRNICLSAANAPTNTRIALIGLTFLQ